MRHLKQGRKLNRTTSHRNAMLANLTTSLLEKNRVTTTVAKAKEVRGVVERQITYGKKGTVAAVRQAAKTVRGKDILKKLFKEIAPGYATRKGGYTRIIKTGPRSGDKAPMAIIELVGLNDLDVKRKRTKKKPTPKVKKQAVAAAPVAESAAPAVTPPQTEGTSEQQS